MSGNPERQGAILQDAPTEPDHRSRATSSLRTGRAWALAALFGLVFGGGILACLDCLGIADWDSFTAHAMVSRLSVLEYGQLPTWNPYHCGGMSVAGNFQSRTYTPSFLLVLLFGAVLGPRLWVILLLAFGFEGARRLATRLGAGPVGALFAALAIAGNGHVIMHIGAGHLSLLTVLLIPWLLLALHVAQAQPGRGIAQAALWGGLMLLEGGLYPIVYAFLLAGLWALVQCASSRSTRPLGALAASALSSMAVGAAVILPSVLYLMEQGGAQVEARELLPISALPQLLLGLDQSIDGRTRFPGQLWWWHEYGTYVGPFFLLLVATGIGRARKHALPWVGMAVFFTLIAFGDLGSLAPWRLLHQLPVFDSMRVPSRALVLAVLCFALAAAPGLDPPGKNARRTVSAAVALLAVNLAAVLAPIPYTAFTQKQDLTPTRGAFHQKDDLGHPQRLAVENHTTTTLDVLHNRGDLDCYDPIRPQVFAREKPPGHPQVELQNDAGPAPGRVRTLAWSPSRLVYAVEVPEPAALIVNQNFAPGWTREAGDAPRSAGGLLATVVRPGETRVVLVYQPLPLYLGLAITLLSLLAAIVVLRRVSHRCSNTRL